jgi:urease accessory protein
VVQRALFPEGPEVPHVYVLHPPGGIVGGDRLRIDVDVEPGAHALLTTPAATKIYRTAGPRSAQHQHLTVRENATLEWLPLENILFDRAAIDLVTEVRLAASSRFIGTEMLCFGLPARGEGFGRGLCSQRFDLWRDDRPILIERGRFDGAGPLHGAAWGLRGAPILAMLVATPAPRDPELLEALRADALPRRADERMGVTRLADTDVLIARYLGHNPEHARAFLGRMWTRLRPALLNRTAIPPRIWNT